MKPVHSNSEVIYLPHKQRPGHRRLYQLITTFAWLAWLYLVQPLASLLLWWLGVDAFHDTMLNMDGIHLSGTLLDYGAVIACIAITIIVWSRYSIWHARRNKRPASDSLTTAEMMCERFDVDRETLYLLYSAKILLMDLDDNESIRCHQFQDQRPVRFGTA